jgi:hypothetical protein
MTPDPMTDDPLPSKLGAEQKEFLCCVRSFYRQVEARGNAAAKGELSRHGIPWRWLCARKGEPQKPFSRPVAGRYADSQNPSGANLYNREGLPACPFAAEVPAKKVNE